jgi:hypothetical protein
MMPMMTTHQRQGAIGREFLADLRSDVLDTAQLGLRIRADAGAQRCHHLLAHLGGFDILDQRQAGSARRAQYRSSAPADR